MANYQKEVDCILRRWGQLKTERASWMSHYQELSMLFAPRSGSFLESANGSQNNNRGEKKHQDIFDNSQLRSVDVMTAGLMAGMTSPARPWFRLGTPDPKLNERWAVRDWLRDIEDTMRLIFAQSNTYRAFRRTYEELGVYGTGADIMLADFKDVIRHYPLTVGEYAISLDDREEVNTLYRQFDMTIDQIVGKFGYANCSRHVQAMYDNKNLTAYVSVIHGIEPRRERNPLKIDNLNMPYTSCYIEASAQEGKFLQLSGFKHFPAVVPRWKVNGHDAYGEAPAMRALGDTKQLQQEQYRKSQAIDFQTMPPLQVPSSLADVVQKGPGGVTIVDNIQQGIKAAWDVDLNLQYLLADIIDIRQRIGQALFEDMFLMFTTTRRGVQPPTAEEISAQQEEKLLMIGPVLENLHDEMLTPTIEKTFTYMIENGLVPPPPPELQGQPLIISFVSTLAQAQRLIGLNSLDRMIGTIGNLAAMKPEVLDKLNGDGIVDAYSDALGIDPDLIVADDKVAFIRQQRAAAQQAQQQVEMMPAAAQTMKDFSEADPARASASVNALKSLGGIP